MVDTLNRISALDLPKVARGWPETRWDINPSNLIISQNGAWAVDWAWPTRGAAFIDVASLVIQLIAAGHTARGAESWAVRCQAWGDAASATIDAFAAATLRMYRSRARRFADASWLEDMVGAARAWVAHRGAGT